MNWTELLPTNFSTRIDRWKYEKNSLFFSSVFVNVSWLVWWLGKKMWCGFSFHFFTAIQQEVCGEIHIEEEVENGRQNGFTGGLDAPVAGLLHQIHDVPDEPGRLRHQIRHRTGHQHGHRAFIHTGRQAGLRGGVQTVPAHPLLAYNHAKQQDV